MSFVFLRVDIEEGIFLLQGQIRYLVESKCMTSYSMSAWIPLNSYKIAMRGEFRNPGETSFRAFLIVYVVYLSICPSKLITEFSTNPS